MKDFYDIWLLAQQFEFDGLLLAKAIHRTFETRKTPVDPKTVALTKEFADDPSKKVQWRAFLRRNRLGDAPNELAKVVQFVAGFLVPVADALTQGPEFAVRWRAPGPWSPR